jgi:hypothetical protein
MAGRGPAPKHPTTRARRNAPMANMTYLPAEGRKGKPPAWPLPADRDLRAALDLAETEAGLIEDEIAHEDGEADPAMRRDLRRALARVVVAEGDLRVTEAEELRLWATLWALPQAVAWERHGYLNEVAQYVRWKVRAELGELQASKEARLVGDRLGLTPASMLHLRWEIVSDELADRRGDPPPATSTRRRAPAKKAGRKPPDPRAALSMVK